MQRFWFGPCEDKVFELIIGKEKAGIIAAMVHAKPTPFITMGF